MDKEAAGKYWSDQLAGAQRAAFPPATNGSSGLTRMINRRCNLPQMADASITKASILRAAWAVVLARYSESDDICFGTTVSGRQAPVHDLSDMAGPCVATVPVRILINRDQSVADFVSSVQTQASKMIAYEQFGIPNISKLTPEAQAACDFTSLLVIQPVQKMAEIDDHGNAILVPFEMDEDIVQSSLEAYFTYPLVVQTLVSDDFFDFSLTYDTSMLAESNMSALLNHLEQVIRLLLEDGSKPVGDVKLAGDWDLNEARAANDEQQTVIDATLHKLFTEQAKLRPDATAINAWDEKLTYGQLDDMSSRLASFLMLSKGVKPGDLIAVCFEKSAWYVVSILAVNKAGAAWVPLDPSHPLERHHQIFQQIGTDVLLSSSKNLHHCSQLTDHVVEVNWNLDNQLLSCAEELPSLEVSPSDPVYVIFTSGSTGKPKGIVMNHGALCTSQLAIIARLGLTSTAKVLQFAAFVFDISIGEIAATLLCGATVCMPSDENRMSNSGLVDFMNGTGVTWSWLTPSFSQTLRPESVPSLGHLIFTGEKANQDCFDLWFGKVRLYNGWGPAETCVVSSIYEYQSKDDAFATMGSPVAAMAWVVDPCNPHQLAPIGVHGELVIQGPTILREYLGEPEKTDASIITNLPSWAPRRYEPHWDRFYMTGDICFYNSHGRLEYVGRKDTQVKIRGLRIELGEIEQQVRSVLDASHLSYQICVEMVDGCVGPTLCCFLCPNEVSYTSGEIEGGLAMGLSEALRSKLLVVDSAVSASLPPYMVPSYYIACRWAPISTSAKLDRKRLRTMAADLSYEELTTYSLTKDTKADPETALENQLRQTWAEVLQIQEDYIGIDDDFYRIGGDSIRAVWLTKRIEEEQNVKLGASLIQSNRTTIRIMAKVIDSNKNGGTLEIEHMDLLSEVTALSKELTGNTVRPLIDSATVAPSTEAVVFLTGAAGYLGSDLLRRIVRLDSTKSVIVLIRSKSAQHGMERVKGTAQTMGWWDDCYADKIEVWPGDLDKERMGLTDAQWTRLSGCSSDGSNVNTIVHNGAAVNWVASYEQLRAANVQSVLDLLNVTINSPTKPRYVFISGGVKLDLSDRAASASMLASLSGYIQTKYVAETAIQDVMDQLPACQNRLSVIKPGRILGTAEEGVANLDDYLWRVVATAISLRAHPVDTLDVWMPCATVSVISERVLSNLTTDGGVIKFDNMEEGLPSEKFWKLAHTALRMESTPMPWKDWIDLAVAQADRVGPKHPLWPIRGFLSVIGWPETPESPPQSPEETEKLHAAVQSNMKYVVGTGMVDICSGKRHKLHGSFISRSGAAKV
jgi:amino acid adenylation domain-containing protein/thioester reductase-like protein